MENLHNYILLWDALSENKLKPSMAPLTTLIFKKKLVCVTESPLKMMKNAFYFILKALFFLKIFKFLSWLFVHIEKTARLER